MDLGRREAREHVMFRRLSSVSRRFHGLISQVPAVWSDQFFDVDDGWKIGTGDNLGQIGESMIGSSH